MRTLYVVATPIGNLEDISLRSLRVLSEVGLIATEDTRKTRILLNKYEIKTNLTSYYEHNKLNKLPFILDKLENEDVALVSEAGMPGISDPGYELVRAAIERSINVVPVPGASALTAALAASGLPTDRFLFVGFLPPRTAARKRALEEIKNLKATLVVYEAPHRVIAALKDMREIFGDRRLAACRELTKLHEEIFRGTISEAIEYFGTPRGEFTLVVDGNKGTPEVTPTDIAEKRLRELRETGITASEAVRQLSDETGLPRRELYRLWLGQK